MLKTYFSWARPMNKECAVQEEIYTHEYLWRSSTTLFEIVEEKSEYSYHIILPAVLTTYLAYEAFINFCGYVLRPELWAQEKNNFKGQPLECKLSKICEKLPDFDWIKGARPYQTIKIFSGFRELAVHGKVKVNDYTTVQMCDASHFSFSHQWDDYLTKANLGLLRTDVKAFCESLLVAIRNHSSHPHIIFTAFEGSIAYGESVSIVAN